MDRWMDKQSESNMPPLPILTGGGGHKYTEFFPIQKRMPVIFEQHMNPIVKMKML